MDSLFPAGDVPPKTASHGKGKVYETFQNFWDNQTPLVRSNVSMGLGFALFTIILHIVAYLTPRLFGHVFIVRGVTLSRLLSTLAVLLFLIAIYNVVRLIWQLGRGQGVITGRGLAVATLACFLLIFTAINLPNVITYAVSYTAGRSFGSIQDDVNQLCDGWLDRFGESDTIVLNVSEENLGPIGEEADVYRVQNTIIFDYGDVDGRFGLACALGTGEPADSGRANDFTFYREDGSIYLFVEETEE